MKTSFRAETATLLLSVALVLTTSAVRADDPQPVKTKHHHQTKTAKAEQTKDSDIAKNHMLKGRDTIPTQDDKNSKEVAGHVTGGGNGPEYRVPTGSHIPREYNRRAYTNDTEPSTYIYDKNDQRLQESNSVQNSLRSVPGVNVGGMRGL